MVYYPVFLDLTGRRAVVIGGGHIAEGKVRGLLEAGARVTLIAPEVTPIVAAWAGAGEIEHLARAYQPGDLAGAFIAISATDDRAVNAQVWQEANERNSLVNVVDDPPHCSFIAPSILRRGDLAVAISTSGKAPALAVRLREQIERLVGQEHADFLALAGALREPLAARFPDFAERKARWYRVVDSDALELLRRGDRAAALRRIHEILGLEDLLVEGPSSLSPP